MCRKATSADLNGIYRLVCKLEDQQLPFDRFERVFKNQLRDDLYCALVFETEDRIVGFLNLRLEEQLHHTDYIAEILELVVDPDFRSHGIGGKILDAACCYARKAGCLQIEVACNQARTDAHRFYLNSGMERSHYRFFKTL